ncbi:hypothetical protein KKC00_01745 [Patescibacteria group bacterium]|nr:hypothetical protein [Patescibacteria group bacterium]
MKKKIKNKKAPKKTIKKKGAKKRIIRKKRAKKPKRAEIIRYILSKIAAI